MPILKGRFLAKVNLAFAEACCYRQNVSLDRHQEILNLGWRLGQEATDRIMHVALPLQSL